MIRQLGNGEAAPTRKMSVATDKATGRLGDWLQWLRCYPQPVSPRSPFVSHPMAPKTVTPPRGALPAGWAEGRIGRRKSLGGAAEQTDGPERIARHSRHHHRQSRALVGQGRTGCPARPNESFRKVEQLVQKGRASTRRPRARGSEAPSRSLRGPSRSLRGPEQIVQKSMFQGLSAALRRAGHAPGSPSGPGR